MIEHEDGFTDFDAIIDDEVDPFGLDDVAIEWRRKTHHTVQRDVDGRPIAHVGLLVAEVQVGAEAFEVALACRTTIVSRNGTRAVCDAGLKALSAEYGLPRAVDPAIEVVGLADEHSTLKLAPGSELEVGDAILLIPGHIDPTVNLHAALHAVEADGTVHRWPVEARRP